MSILCVHGVWVSYFWKSLLGLQMKPLWYPQYELSLSSAFLCWSPIKSHLSVSNETAVHHASPWSNTHTHTHRLTHKWTCVHRAPSGLSVRKWDLDQEGRKLNSKIRKTNQHRWNNLACVCVCVRGTSVNEMICTLCNCFLPCRAASLTTKRERRTKTETNQSDKPEESQWDTDVYTHLKIKCYDFGNYSSWDVFTTSLRWRKH